MAELTLPSGAVFDFGDLSQEDIADRLNTLSGSNPELFQEPVAQSEGPPDPATTPFAELQEYYNRGSGSSELSPEVTNEGEVKDAAAQFFVGRGDTDEERELRLSQIFGEESVIRLGQDDFALDSEKIDPALRKKYGLADTGTTRFNEKGLSWQDVSSFLGSETVPMVAAIGAGVAATGLGTLPGVGVVALAGAAGKAFDEFIIEDVFEGLQRQSTTDVLKDVAIQGLVEAGGEVVGRAIGKTVSALVRGKGPPVDSNRVAELRDNYISQGEKPSVARRLARGAAREEAAALYNRLARQGANMPVTTATGKNLLGRTQAIWESIFPPEASVSRNVEFVKDIQKRLSLGEIGTDEAKEEIAKVGDYMVSTLSASMADPKKAIAIAQKELKTVLEAEFKVLKDVLDNSNAGFTGLSKEFQDGLDLSTKMFTLRSNQLYTNADNLLSNEAIDLGPLKNRLKLLQDDEVSGGLGLRGGIFKVIGEMESLEIKQVPALRASLRASVDSPDMLGTMAGRQVTELVKELDVAVKVKENNLATDLLKAQRQPSRFIGKSPSEIKARREGLELLKAANNHYAEGAEIINSGLVNQISTQIKNKNAVDFKTIVDQTVLPGKPALLRTILDVITPSSKEINLIVDTAKNEPAAFREMADRLARGDEDAISFVNEKLVDLGLSPSRLAREKLPKDSLLSIPETFSRLPATDPTRLRLQNDFSETLNMYARMAEAGSSPAAYRQGFRDLFAKQWLSDALPKNTMDDGFNYPALAANFDALTPALQKELFGNKVTDFRKVMNDFKLMGRTGSEQMANFSGDVANAEARGIVETFKAVAKQAEDESKDAFLSTMRGAPPEADKLVTNVLNNPKNYETLKNRLGENFMESPGGFKDLVMTRIVSAGFPDGKITDTIVQSGSWGKNWLDQINTLNKNKSLDIILGKESVKQLEDVAKSGITISDSVLKGKTGLAAAAYSAAFLGALWMAPLATLTAAGGMYVASRALRNETVLRYLTRPRLRAFEAERAMASGADLSTWEAKKRVVDPLTGVETVGALGSRNLSARKAREAAARSIRLITAELGYYATERGSDAVSREIIDPAVEDGAPIVQDIRRQAAPFAAQAQQTGADALRQIEENKLMGVGANQ